MTWWFLTFMAPAIKSKVHQLPGVEHLYAVMTRDQLEIPAYITEYDMAVNINKFIIFYADVLEFTCQWKCVRVSVYAHKLVSGHMKQSINQRSFLCRIHCNVTLKLTNTFFIILWH